MTLAVDDGYRSAGTGSGKTRQRARARIGDGRFNRTGMDGGLAERVRREFGADGDGSLRAGPGVGLKEVDAPIDQRLGELIGDSLVLQEATERVVSHTVVPETADLLNKIRSTQRRLLADPRVQTGGPESPQVIRAVVVEYLDYRVAFMDSCLDPGFTLEEGFDFIAMCLAEALGRWGVLARLAGTGTPLAELADEAHGLLQPQLASVLTAITAGERSA